MRRLLALLIIALLLPAGCARAGWDLEGELLDLVVNRIDFDEYDSLCPQINNIAALCTPEHNVLIMKNRGGLETYTGVLFQPGGSYDGVPVIAAKDAWLSIVYTEDLWYVFQEINDSYILAEGMFNDLMVEWSVDGTHYIFTDLTGETVRLPRRILMEEFNVELFPKTLDEVRHLNLMHATLDGGRHCLGWGKGELMTYAEGQAKASVFTAPYGDDAFRVRAGSKNATVSFNGDVWLLKEWRNERGGEYYMVRYNVSAGKQRIGFIYRSHLDGPGAEPWPDTDALNTRVIAVRDTILTDDPDVSNSRVMHISKGGKLRCFGTYNENYAYVGTVDRSGRQVWGFIPLRDLMMFSHKAYRPETKLMEQLEGLWRRQTGNVGEADLLTLRADGTYEGCPDQAGQDASGEPSVFGTWSVTRYDPAAGLYMNDPSYEITFAGHDGNARVEGLSFRNGVMTLCGFDDQSVYERVE